MVDLEDYKKVIQQQLQATYKDESRTLTTERPTCVQHLQHLKSKAQELVDEGVTEGFIHPDDASVMRPVEAKPGRYYGLAKVHKSQQLAPSSRRQVPSSQASC